MFTTKWEALNKLTPQFLAETFSRLSGDVLRITSYGVGRAITWPEFCSALNLTTEEIEEKAQQNQSWNRLITLYKQYCLSSQLAILTAEKKYLVEIYKHERFGGELNEGITKEIDSS